MKDRLFECEVVEELSASDTNALVVELSMSGILFATSSIFPLEIWMKVKKVHSYKTEL